MFSLCFRLSAGVPEVDDVYDVIVDAVHHFVQAIDDNAAVGHGTIGIERVDGADVRAALDMAFSILDPLHELLSCLATKLCVDVAGNLAV